LAFTFADRSRRIARFPASFTNPAFPLLPDFSKPTKANSIFLWQKPLQSLEFPETSMRTMAG
jgi:hypothetical protein